MTDVTPTDESDNCGCCLPPPNDADHRVERLLAGRNAVDERLARLELVGAAR